MSTEAAPPQKSSKGPLLLVLINTLAITSAAGVLIYTRFLYQKPKFTEKSERERIESAAASPRPAPTAGLMAFEPMIINLGPQAGNDRIVKLSFSLELQEEELKVALDRLKPVLLDQLLYIVSRKQLPELTTVQGRYVLRTEILDLANGLVQKDTGRKETLVTNVYFNEFIVQ